MYLHMYLPTYLHVPACPYIYIYLSIHLFTHLSIHPHAHTHTHMFTQILIAGADKLMARQAITEGLPKAVIEERMVR